MPITGLQIINSTDKLQSGFRAKFNANVALLITDITDNGDGTLTMTLQGGTNFIVDLTDSFYTKAQVVSLIGAVTTVAWGDVTGNVADQTDVVGNYGVISPINDILVSGNFAVDAADPDNPFGSFPASGYSSFSVPGISGTGWQLLIKENSATEIKFRIYNGAWGVWASITPSATVITKTRTTADADTYTLTSGELLILNTYTRYPNFVAIVTSTGQQFFDIYPTYTGTIGNFTACVVQLHSDGAGLNADDTFIQFS